MPLITSKRSVMTLFSSDSCPYSHRCRIVLAEKNITVEVINIRSEEDYQELAEVNPYQSLPTLLDRELMLYQSSVIMEYLDERFPHPPLMPVYPVARGRSRLMIQRIEKDWYHLMNSILGGGKDAEPARRSLSESLLGVAPVFAEMPFFLSEEFSLVDCCLAPLLWRLPSLGVELPARSGGRAIKDYADRLFARDSFVASLSASERAIDHLKTA